MNSNLSVARIILQATLLLLVWFSLTSLVHGSTEDEDVEDESPYFTGKMNNRAADRCPTPFLTNGRVKIRSRGRVAKFICRPFFQTLGKRFTTCIRGRWSFPPPLCISQGCIPLLAPRNGRLSLEMKGAMAKFYCNPGYTLTGSPSLYCDSVSWNSTETPKCSPTLSEPLTSEVQCDFEKDMCGWSQDLSDDFDWKRYSLNTPSGDMGTGPSFDHTKGEGEQGYYLYIEASSPRKDNDVARLYSPVYDGNIYSNGCFRFWYHMYGDSTGAIKVKIKTEPATFASLEPVFVKERNQGNIWHSETIRLPEILYRFQIIIEAVRGNGYASDSAIDDVLLLNQEECGPLLANDSSYSSDDWLNSFSTSWDSTDLTSSMTAEPTQSLSSIEASSSSDINAASVDLNQQTYDTPTPSFDAPNSPLTSLPTNELTTMRQSTSYETIMATSIRSFFSAILPTVSTVKSNRMESPDTTSLASVFPMAPTSATIMPHPTVLIPSSPFEFIPSSSRSSVQFISTTQTPVPIVTSIDKAQVSSTINIPNIPATKLTVNPAIKPPASSSISFSVASTTTQPDVIYSSTTSTTVKSVTDAIIKNPPTSTTIVDKQTWPAFFNQTSSLPPPRTIPKYSATTIFFSTKPLTTTMRPTFIPTILQKNTLVTFPYTVASIYTTTTKSKQTVPSTVVAPRVEFMWPPVGSPIPTRLTTKPTKLTSTTKPIAITAVTPAPATRRTYISTPSTSTTRKSSTTRYRPVTTSTASPVTRRASRMTTTSTTRTFTTTTKPKYTTSKPRISSSPNTFLPVTRYVTSRTIIIKPVTTTTKRIPTTKRTTTAVILKTNTDHPVTTTSSSPRNSSPTNQSPTIKVDASTEFSNHIDESDILSMTSKPRAVLPPWTYLKRNNDPGELGSSSNELNPLARTSATSISVPTVIGASVAALGAVLVIAAVIKGIYKRRRLRRHRLSDDSDVRYLKDGEVRMEFSDGGIRDDDL